MTTLTLGLGIYGILLILALFSHFLNLPIPHAFDRLLSILLTALYLFSLTAAGRLVIGRLQKEKKESNVWTVLHSFGTGVGMIGLVLFLLGWLPAGSLRIKLWIVSAALALPIVINGKNTLKDIRRLFRWAGPASPTAQFFLFVGSLGAILTFGACFGPITYYDSLVYHLALPKYYLAQGKISSVPFNLYSHFPALIEMHFMLFLANFPDPEAVIDLFLWAISFALSLGVATWVREEKGREMAYWAWGLYWSAPVVMLLSIGGYIDIPLAFFTFLAVRCFHDALRRNAARSLLLAGLFSGFACSVKYTGVLTPAVLTGILFFSPLKNKAFKYGFILGGTAFLVFCPWLLKNALEVGNPVFPFLYHVFPSGVTWTAQTAQSYFQMLTQYGAKSRIFQELVRLPFVLAGQPTKFGGGFDVLGDFGWTLILFTAPLGLVWGLQQRKNRFIVVYLVLHCLVWYLTKPVLRFLTGVFPLLVVLSVMGLGFLKSKGSKLAFQSVLWCFVGPMIVSNFFLFFFINQDLQLYRVVLNHESRHEYLLRRLPYMRAFDYLNHIQPPPRDVLIVGEQRTYHLNIPYESSNLFAPSRLAQWANQAADAREIFLMIDNQGISHLSVHWPEIGRLGGLKKFGFGEIGLKNLRDFIERYTTAVKIVDGIEVRAIHP